MAIAYSSMTVRQAVDEVLLRMKQARTATNMDYGTVLKMLQESRRNLAAIIAPFKEYALIKTAAVTHQGVLPSDFIMPVRAILQAAAAEYTEARRIDPREHNELTNTSRPHSFGAGTTSNPVYMIWVNTETATPTWAETNMAFWCHPTTLTGEIDYVAFYGDTDADADGESLNVPAETENLLINLTLERCFFRVGEQAKMAAAYKKVQQDVMGMRARTMASSVTEAIEIQSLINTEPTQVPATGGRQ